MKSTGKTVAIVIFVITTIIAIGVAVYFKIDSNSTISKLEENLNNYSLELYSANEEIRNNIKYPIELNRCLNNNTSNLEFKIPEVVSPSEIYSASVNSNNKEITINFSWDRVNETYSMESGKTGNEKVEIKNFETEILNIYFLENGQEDNSETLYILMTDGSVEFVPIAYAVKNNKFESYGKIENVTEISYITRAKAIDNDENLEWITAIAVKNDGSFYNLPAILNETTKYYKEETTGENPTEKNNEIGEVNKIRNSIDE